MIFLDWVKRMSGGIMSKQQTDTNLYFLSYLLSIHFFFFFLSVLVQENDLKIYDRKT